ncbi:unnamed protein product [Rotaria socialis]|uniref:Uncharacterized protein n=2 Tax=Rotaria socialis TaxID=392032 RepID=A0A817TEH3_9BILA|nr:unnamed protein product [Rotaria socialis]CAF4679192.1 unnamed protein product [Rotaria socialis]
MVKCVKKTTAPVNTKKANEKENFLRSKVISSKKIQKLEPGDEVSFGQRGGRIRGIVLMIGAESQCENSRRIIEKTTTVKNKTNKNKAKTIDKAESETDDMNNVEANDDGESDEDIKSIDAEEVSSGDEKGAESTASSQKRKLLSDSDDKPFSKYSRNLDGKSAQTGVYGALQRKIDSLESQALEYQTTWMPRPTDQTTIDYLIDIGKILSGEANLDPDEKSEILLNITTTLDLTEKQLETCKGKNIRVTVRQIMKMLHPDPPNDFKFAEVDRNHVAAVREYARLVHPREEKLYTDDDPNHAMGNLFAVKTHKQNLKLSNTE